MRERLELFVNLWTFGAPVALMTWALLRLTGNAPARMRYLIAIAGFLAVPAAALLAPLRTAAVPAAAVPASRRHLEIADVAAAPLTITWTTIAALLLLRDALGHARLRRTRRALRDAPWLRDLDWPAPVPLAVSDHPSPFTIGLLRPVVVLPADLSEGFPAEVLRRIARHELAHARWRDPLVFAALRMVAAIFWLSPAWLVLRWVRREREAAADAWALHGASGEEESYIAALLRLAGPARAPAADMAASDLEYRARCIVAPQRASPMAVVALMGGAFLLSIAAPARLDADGPVTTRHVHVVVHVHRT